MIGRLNLAVLLLLPAVLVAADIHGTVEVKRPLTRRNVTAPVGAYQRGAGVPLELAPDADPLAYERRHVAVFIEGSGPSAPQTIEILQRNRLFGPDLVAVPVGSSVSFPNLDVIFHNVFSLSQTKTFDLGNYPKGQTRVVKFPKPGVVLVNCRLHPNMSAAIVITPNRWVTLPDAEGRFALSGVPPGRYTIAAWHKAAGHIRQAVEVTAEGAAVEFLVPLDGMK